MIVIILTILFVPILLAIRMMLVEAVAGWLQDRRYEREMRR